MNTYYTNLTDWLNSFSQSEGMVSAFIQEGLDTAYQFINNWVRNDLPQHMQALLPAAAESLGAVIGFFSNLIIGIVVSVYLLFSKEKFIAQMKKLTYACLKKERANAVIEVSQHANRMFSGFISGRILDSAIIGILCFNRHADPRPAIPAPDCRDCWGDEYHPVLRAVYWGYPQRVPDSHD